MVVSKPRLDISELRSKMCLGSKCTPFGHSIMKPWFGFLGSLSVIISLVAANVLLSDDEPSNIASPVQSSSTNEPNRPSGPSLTTEFGEVAVFPADNVWNQPIDHLQVHPKSAAYMGSIGLSTPLHPDWGNKWEGKPIGMPITVVRGGQPGVPVRFEYADESDHGLYPVPKDVMVEGGNTSDGDRHVILVDYDNKRLYELYSARNSKLGWTAGSGAIFDLTSNRSRPLGWTSADAAGLPILPGIVRCDEVYDKKLIAHALRFTVQKTQDAFIHPARHAASRSSSPNLPPMGLRLRLKQSYDISGFPEPAQVILKGLKKYGMILADNGSNLFMTGTHDKRWDSDEMATLKRVKASDLEAVYTGEIVR